MPNQIHRFTHACMSVLVDFLDGVLLAFPILWSGVLGYLLCL